MEVDGASTIPPRQDTNEYTILDNPHQQPLYSNSSEQMLQSVQLSQLEMETEAIVRFNADLSTDLMCQQQSNLPGDPLSSSVASLVCNYNSTVSIAHH